MQVGEVTYFFVTNADNQNELRKTDGTSQGTVLVKQGVGPGGTQGLHKWVSPPGWYNVYNGIVYFAGTNEWGLSELWRTNGTEAGTFRVLNEAGTFYFSDPKHLVLYNQYLVFTSGDYFFHRIDSNLEPPQFMFTLPSAPTSNVIYHHQKLFFIAYNLSTNLHKLFESDTTSAIVTPEAVDLELKPEQDLIFFKGNLFFSARYTGGGEQSHGFELYKISPVFTTELIIDINPTSDSNPEVLGVAKEWLIFTADNGTDGRTLWRNNNIPGGIYQVDQFGGSSVGPFSLGALGDRLIYPADGNLWAIDGPSGNTYQLSSATASDYMVWAAYGSKLYYSALDPTLGIEVQVTDGSSAAIYKDINPGLPGSLPQAMSPCGSSLCISADDGQHGTELWATNGDPDDVQMVADINPRPINSNPANITTAGTMTFFHADDGIKADSLWRTDGTQGEQSPLSRTKRSSFPLISTAIQGLYLRLARAFSLLPQTLNTGASFGYRTELPAGPGWSKISLLEWEIRISSF